MKRIFGIFVFASLLAVSCQKEMDNQNAAGAGNDRDLVYMEFTTQSEPTKTYIDDVTKNVLWLKNDAVSIFPAGTANSTGGDKFTTQDDMVAAATFTGESELAESYYALYPYKSDASVTADGKITLTLPNWQKAAVGTLADGYNYSVGVAENGKLSMKNVSSLIKFTVPEDMDNLQTVMITSHGGTSTEPLVGTVNVEALTGDVIGGVVNGNASAQVSASPNALEAGKSYYLAVLPVSFGKGFTVKMTYTDGKSSYMFSGVPMTLERNKVLNLKGLDRFESFVLNDFEDEAVPSYYSTINTDGASASGKVMSVVDNPVPNSTVNQSQKVFMDDMGKNNNSTSAYFTVNLGWDQAKLEFPYAARSKYSTIKVKVYLGTNAYCPYLKLNLGGTQFNMAPTRINGQPFSDWNTAVSTTDWNVLEYDVEDFNAEKSNFGELNSMEIRPCCDASGNNAPNTIDPVTNTKIVYYDDIEFLY